MGRGAELGLGSERGGDTFWEFWLHLRASLPNQKSYSVYKWCETKFNFGWVHACLVNRS
jgi:hypothetical protein